MRKNYFLLSSLLLTAGSMMAQTTEAGGELIALLNDDVKAVINMDNKKPQKAKNMEVAGSPEKGYKAFFAATDATHGEELWVTDGTKEGTKLVKDIMPGANGSDVSYLTRFNDKVVFAANDGKNGIQLWISDGTEEGTHMVKLIHDMGDASPVGFTQLDENRFIFAAMDYDSESYADSPQRWLWISDGTEEGTKLLKQCKMEYPGRVNEAERWAPYVRVGRKVFFKADDIDSKYGTEVWVTDGTEEGTFMLKDINVEQMETGTADSAPDHFFNFYNEKLFFKAWSLESGNEPWASDGTKEGTYEIYNTVDRLTDTGKGQGGDLNMVGATPFNGMVFFRSKNDKYGEELAMTNCEKGNFSIVDINKNDPTNENNSFPDPGIEFDGAYIFCADSGNKAEFPETNKGGELHYTTDGKTIKLQSDLGPGLQSNWAKELTVVSGSLYWWNESRDDVEKQTKLYRLNSKDEAPVRVTNLFTDGDQIHTLRNLGGNLIFTTDNAAKNVYVYKYRKPNYDPEKDADNLEPEYRTRKEMGGVSAIKSSNGSVSIFPNPAVSQFNIESESEVNDVKVYDLAGRLVMTAAESEVNVASLAAGLYKVVVNTEEGTFSVSLIKK